MGISLPVIISKLRVLQKKGERRERARRSEERITGREGKAREWRKREKQEKKDFLQERLMSLLLFAMVVAAESLVRTSLSG